MPFKLLWRRLTLSDHQLVVADGSRYEIDARQIPSNWTTGYFLFGTTQPGEVATTIYGTEVFEVGVPV